MSLSAKITESLKTAMRNKNQGQLRALRAIKSALLLAATEKGAGKELNENKEIQLLQKLAKQRKDVLEIYEQQNRPELVKKEKEELAVIESFLPAQMSEAELEKILKSIIEKTGASSPADMGKVMGMAKSEIAGRADGKTLAQTVKKLLQ